MKFFTSALLLLVSLNFSYGSDWGTSYADALSKAKTENKKVLLDFTGSDWCGYCKLLDKEVFSTSAFQTFADKNYVLVTIDFPHQTQLPPNTQKQNEDLGKRFQIDGYPTLIVIDPNTDKEITRQVGYNPGSGPDAVIGALSK